jgi:anti-sigma factor RsiW
MGAAVGFIEEKQMGYWLSCYLDDELSVAERREVERLLLRFQHWRYELALMKRSNRCIDRVLRQLKPFRLSPGSHPSTLE